MPSTSVPKRISLKNVNRLTFLVICKNGGAPVAGTIALTQSKTVAGGSEKALAFTKAAVILDAAVTDVFTEFDVASNTFSTDATASKDIIYAIDVLPESLDINNGFDCVGVATGNATQQTTTVLAICMSKYSGVNKPSVIVD